MSAPDRSEAESPPAGAEARREPVERPDEPDTLDEVVSRLGDIAGALQRLLDVQVARARVQLREKTFRFAQFLLLGVLTFALAVTGSLYLLRGIAGLVSELTAASWAGQLAAGVLALLTGALLAYGVRSRLRRRGLQRMEERFRDSDGETP